MKRGLSLLLAIIVVFCTLSSVTATVYADYSDFYSDYYYDIDYDANLVAHKKIDNILQNYVDPECHLDKIIIPENEEAELRSIVEEVIDDCHTQYEKIAAVTNFVAENIYYDYDYYEGRTTKTYIMPYEVWTNKRTVCDGYARLMKEFLNLINIPCIYVTTATNVMSHAYNVAYDSENGRWIYLDATWCSGNRYRYGEYSNGLYDVSKFDMSLEDISKLLYHEIVYLSGIVVNGIKYRLETPVKVTDWSSLDEWYVSVVDVTDGFDAKTVEIVDSFKGIPVTRIGGSAFQDCTSLTSIKIPNSVTSIASAAFRGCTNLKSIKIPNSVKNIGVSAFYGCTSLKSIEIPDSIKRISSTSFSNCSSLVSVTIGNNVTCIEGAAFDGCANLSSITIPDSVTSIGGGAFKDCTSLTSITIPDSVTSIGGNAFDNTGYYNNSKNWKDKVLYIGKHLIKANEYISGDCVIKDGTKTISDYAFENCHSLKSVIIPNSVKYLGGSAFFYCNNLKVVNIPASVTSIDSNTFYYCINLKSVKISDGVKSVGERTFYDCKELTAIKIPDSVKSIGEYAFGYYFDNNSYTTKKIDGFTIYGNSGTVAEAYAKENGFTFKTTCDHISSYWITDKKATVYATGKKRKECAVCGETLKTVTIKQLKCSEPNLKSIENTQNGVLTKWSKVKGADKYYIYRKTNGVSYSRIGSTTKSYYTDKTAKSGTKYYYIVKAINEVGSSSSSNSLSKYYLADPTLKKITNSEYGVKITWRKVSGAEKYNVYRKTSSGSYSKIGTTSKAYYTDKKAKSGRKYYYIVKTVKGSVTSASSSAKSIFYLADTTLKTPISTTSGIKLSWSKVTGAEGYIIYRKTGSGSYTKLKTEKGVSNLSYTDSSAKKGKKYTYKVKAYKSKTYSAYSNTKTITDKY